MLFFLVDKRYSSRFGRISQWCCVLHSPGNWDEYFFFHVNVGYFSSDLEKIPILVLCPLQLACMNICSTNSFTFIAIMLLLSELFLYFTFLDIWLENFLLFPALPLHFYWLFLFCAEYFIFNVALLIYIVLGPWASSMLIKKIIVKSKSRIFPTLLLGVDLSLSL